MANTMANQQPGSFDLRELDLFEIDLVSGASFADGARYLGNSAAVLGTVAAFAGAEPLAGGLYAVAGLSYLAAAIAG